MNLLRAWKQTLRSQPLARDWVLAIAGWDQGGHEAELQRFCTEMGLEWVKSTEGTNGSLEYEGAEVMFLGPQFGEGKAACYRDCDAFILPSFSEGLPMVVLEAWAYSKPVLMTPECNLPEGFFTDAAFRIETNPQSIAQGLCSLVEAPSSALELMGSRGRTLVLEQFSWPVVAEEMARLYRWVLGGGEQPASLTEKI
jgi:glycosyltransferase involved in cell wall biosynthesis